MKKSLILLTSLLVAGVAATPLVQQAKNTNHTSVTPQEEILKSNDVVDLTMTDAITSVKVDLPDLSNLLNKQLGEYQLTATVMSLTNKDNVKLDWVNESFNDFMLALVLGTVQSIDQVTLSVSKYEPALNYLSAYYHNVEGREGVTKIGMFDWSNYDMSSYWTKDVMFGFELHY